MDQWNEIRRRVLVEGVSRRQVQRETGLHWKPLTKILGHSEPPGYRQKAPLAKKRLRPFTGVASACLPGTKNARCIAQALDPINPSRISASQSWAFSWNWINLKGTVPKGWLIALACELRIGEKWWFVYTDGVYHSTDGGKTFNPSTIP